MSKFYEICEGCSKQSWVRLVSGGRFLCSDCERLEGDYDKAEEQHKDAVITIHKLDKEMAELGEE